MTTMHHTVVGHVSHATTRQFTGRKTFSIALTRLSLGLVLGPPAPVEAQSAWVATDSSQYLAGEVITVTGAGFGPYATVTVRVTHADGGAEPDIVAVITRSVS